MYFTVTDLQPSTGTLPIIKALGTLINDQVFFRHQSRVRGYPADFRWRRYKPLFFAVSNNAVQLFLPGTSAAGDFSSEVEVGRSHQIRLMIRTDLLMITGTAQSDDGSNYGR